MANISAFKAAKLLGISVYDVKQLEAQEILHNVGLKGQESLFSPEEIGQIKSHKAVTISDEAALISNKIQKDTVTSISFAKRTLILIGIVLLTGVIIVAALTVLLIINPIQTAQWLGLIKPDVNVSLSQKDQNVMGTENINK